MIEPVQRGLPDAERMVTRLVPFALELGEEEQLSEEEEAMTHFHLLTKPEVKLTKNKEEWHVQEVAKDLLATLRRGKLVLN